MKKWKECRIEHCITGATVYASVSLSHTHTYTATQEHTCQQMVKQNRKVNFKKDYLA